MNWTRYKLLMISGALAVVVCGGLLFWILSGNTKAQDLENALRSLQSRQTQLTSADPYPSEANLLALGVEQQKVRDRRDAIREAISEGQLKVDRVNRNVFGDYIRTVVPSLREAAAAATTGGEDGVVLRDPDFGLTDFLGGTLPSQLRINELVVEIEIITHLAQLLFDAGISELVTIEVIQEEDAPARRLSGGVPGRPSGGPPGMGRPGRPGAEEEPDIPAEQKETERLFDSLRVRVEFNAYEDFFWDSLNGLLADSNQMAISSMSVTNSNELLWPDYIQGGSAGTRERRDRTRPRPQSRRTRKNDLLSLLGGVPADGAAVDDEAPEKKQAGLENRRKYVVGGDLLNVVMELNVFRLKEEQAEAQPEGA